jgi:imidazolonepropionase-like amidohydrolase
LVKLREARIPLLLAPDSGGRELCITPGYSTHDALQILTDNGFTPYEAMATSTVNAAQVVEAMTGEGDFGTLQVGNRADLILVARNPLEDVANIRDPLGVMAAGKWYSRETLQRMMAIEERAGSHS